MCSQRCYYPQSLHKPSQDAQCVHTDFNGETNQAFFGVFDGHGEAGTPCSEFARDIIPELIMVRKGHTPTVYARATSLCHYSYPYQNHLHSHYYEHQRYRYQYRDHPQ